MIEYSMDYVGRRILQSELTGFAEVFSERM